MKLVVGLGNPGSEYEKTRHNAGFMAVDRFARQHGAMSWRTAHESFACDVLIGTEKVIVLKPMTYMNLSGRAAASAMQFYKIGIDDLLVVVDDIALPCGSIRLRATGSAGGHNGLADIQRAVASAAMAAMKLPVDYARLRIGIDPPGRVPQKDYVLGTFSAAQWPQVDVALTRSVEAIECWIKDGITVAMNRFNLKE
jgi:PTH1 family peptidyl-tRNA hydrolase